jgi:hypothetical protein
MVRSLLVLCGSALLLGVWQPVRADILYGNLSNAPSSVDGTFPIGTYSTGEGPEGDSFSTGASPFLLTDVVLALQGVQDSDSFSVALYTDNNSFCAPGPVCTGGPLTPLYTIASDVGDNSLSTSLTDDAFTLATPQTLSANTRYWIIASSTNGSGTLWSYTEDLSGVGIAGEFNDTALDDASANDLLPNSNDSINNPNCFSKAGADFCTPFQMEVSGNTVPEPKGLGIMSIGLAALAGLILRRKRLQHS